MLPLLRPGLCRSHFTSCSERFKYAELRRDLGRFASFYNSDFISPRVQQCWISRFGVNLPNNPRRIASHAVKRWHIFGHHASSTDSHSSPTSPLVSRHIFERMSLRLYIVTPGRTITYPPSQQSSPITIGAPSSGPLIPFRRKGSRGCVPL